MNRQWALIGAILLASGLTGSSYTMATPPYSVAECYTQ